MKPLFFILLLTLTASQVKADVMADIETASPSYVACDLGFDLFGKNITDFMGHEQPNLFVPLAVYAGDMTYYALEPSITDAQWKRDALLALGAVGVNSLVNLVLFPSK